MAKIESLVQERKYFTNKEIDQLKKEITGVIDDAVDFAEKSPMPQPEDALEGVYAT